MTPLFRQGGQRPFTVAQVRGSVKYLMQSLGLDPRKFGAHSLPATMIDVYFWYSEPN